MVEASDLAPGEPAPSRRSAERAERDSLDRLRAAGLPLLPADLPGEAYPLPAYAEVVYGRSSRFFQVVRDALGTDRFDAALSRVHRRHRGRRITADVLIRAFRRAAPPSVDVDALVDRWIRSPVPVDEL